MVPEKAKEIIENELKCLDAKCEGICSECDLYKFDDEIKEAFKIAIKALDNYQER